MRMKYCTIEWTEQGSQTSFDNGLTCQSVPHETEHYHIIARRCGCGDDVRMYCRDHELAHVLLSQVFQEHAPRALLETTQYGHALNWGENIMEECTAHVIQRWVRCGERPIIGNCDWDSLRAAFLRAAEWLDKEFNERADHDKHPCASARSEERDAAPIHASPDDRVIHIHD